MHLSPNFTITEFTRSQTAARLGLDNTPPPSAILAMRLLCSELLEPLRSRVGGPIVITSGFRSPALNVQIGGARNSQHSRGQAADFERPGISNFDLAREIEASGLPFDQLILEAYVPGVPSSGWVHASYSQGANRRQVLTATPRRGGGMTYSTGLRR